MAMPTVERDVSRSGAAVMRNVPAYFPDAVRGFGQPQGLVVTEVRYEELFTGRVRNHLVRVR